MSLPKIINSLGLLCDILGALLIWKFGLPEQISRTGAECLELEETNEADKAKARTYDKFARLGVILLVGGFTLQLVSNFIPQR